MSQLEVIAFLAFLSSFLFGLSNLYYIMIHSHTTESGPLLSFMFSIYEMS